MKQSASEKFIQVVVVTMLALLCVAVLYPFLYMLAISLNEGSDAAKGGVYILPRAFTLINYEIVLSLLARICFGR